MGNYLVVYTVKNYSEKCFRTFIDLTALARFIKFNNLIESYDVYRIYKNYVDLNSLLAYNGIEV